MSDLDQEREANVFAAELLMPRHFIVRDMALEAPLDTEHDDRIKKLAKRYGVSTQMMTVRLAKLGYLMLWMVLVLTSCSTPFSVSGGFFGASVTVDFPRGIQVPAKVIKTDVKMPVLMVPSETQAPSSVPVTTAGGVTIQVPVVKAPEVTQAILAVPSK